MSCIRYAPRNSTIFVGNSIKTTLQKNETRSLQSTGTNEEVNDHIEVRNIDFQLNQYKLMFTNQRLTSLVSLLDDVSNARAAKTKEKQRKVSLEDEASWQLREASMKGLVRGETLVDVSTLPSASIREKQAQQGTKYVLTFYLSIQVSDLIP